MEKHRVEILINVCHFVLFNFFTNVICDSPVFNILMSCPLRWNTTPHARVFQVSNQAAEANVDEIAKYLQITEI